MPTIITPPANAASASQVYFASVPVYGATPTAVTASSEATSYPAALVTDYLHPQRPWKPTSAGDESLVLDLGAPILLGALHVGFLVPGTMASFTLQANATNSWGGSLALDVTIPIKGAFNPTLRRYRYTHVLEPGIAEVRYVRFVAPSHAGAVVALGQLVAMRYTGTAFIAPRAGFVWGWRQAGVQNRFEDGGSEHLAFGARQLLLSFPWEYGWNYRDADAPETAIVDTTLQVGADEPTLIVRDRLYLPQWGSILRRPVGEDLLMTSSAGVGAAVPVSFEEVLK